MTELENDYPDVKFIYMTGHLDIWSWENLKARNQQIRDYCIANDKILFDFADIESYDPDSTYFEYANDNCNYYSGSGGTTKNPVIVLNNRIFYLFFWLELKDSKRILKCHGILKDRSIIILSLRK